MASGDDEAELTTGQRDGNEECSGQEEAQEPVLEGFEAEDDLSGDFKEFIPEAEADAGGFGYIDTPDGGDEEDEEYDSEPEVHEEMKDAIEGAFRLKRLLSRDFSEPENLGRPPLKRIRSQASDIGPRSVAETAKVAQLLNKWGLSTDPLTRHVLENLTLPELEILSNTNYTPDLHNVWKVPAELLQTHMNLVRESRGSGGGFLDVISCFRHRWKLDLETDAALRGLSHKVLRYVIREYDGSQELEELIRAGSDRDPEDESICLGAAPDHVPGVEVMNRYSRLELIDPVADSAVFGDANLTFSLALAKQRKALGHVGRVVATTFENYETLQERYKEIDATIATLETYFAEVYHSVDCTRIAIDQRFAGMAGTLGAVYYNFPHAGAVGGFFDGHPVVNWRHENLMRLFFRALRSFMKPGGIVKVSSNSGAVGVRFSYIIDSAAQNEFVHVETMPFLQWGLHRYGRSYGDRRDTYKRPGEGEQYNAQRADSDMVYCFIYRPSGEPLPRQQIRMPPTYKTLLGVTDGPLGERQGEMKKKYATELYKRFMAECSGIHVG
mmetsp:Transcript_64311/g.139978  ORF Transcript_64311/g.139978 Transcript_64311/m.139978 type:complete len:555 (-) Transcript_64311:21-1685(-)